MKVNNTYKLELSNRTYKNANSIHEKAIYRGMSGNRLTFGVIDSQKKCRYSSTNYKYQKTNSILINNKDNKKKLCYKLI